ncbi:MAG TPA: DUF1127 domain-containing protein [Afifellaceae bacterium]|nr:DUF1127 domain-containing protein [Afifellaceae bacterium]
MVSMTEHDGPARGASRRRHGTFRARIAAFFDGVRAERQRAVDRRLMEELPDYLLDDMGISRGQFGVPRAAADILRDAGAWR